MKHLWKFLTDPVKAWKRKNFIDSMVNQGITILPDGTAFFVGSFPLPADHWLTIPKDLENDADWVDPIPLLLNAKYNRDRIVEAAHWAIRGATNCGKDMDFDPDALTQNIVYALCGPSGTAYITKEEPDHDGN